MASSEPAGQTTAKTLMQLYTKPRQPGNGNSNKVFIHMAEKADSAEAE